MAVGLDNKEYIEREKLLGDLVTVITDYLKDNSIQCSIAAGVAINIKDTVVMEQPVADVVRVKHGYWKPTKESSYFGGIVYKCSLCEAKDGEHSKILGNYCWRCGAKMDLKEGTS